jgi:hypothetical protein
MHIHQPFADGCQDIQRRGRAVDELTVGPRIGERALEDELIFRARFQPVFIEKRIEPRAQFPIHHVEHRLHGATVLAAADQRAISPFTQHQAQCPDDDGLARTGFPRHGIAPRLEFQRQVAHQGEIFDAQRRQHVRFDSTKVCG